MTQRIVHSHAEAIVNVVVGAGLAQCVLWAFGVPVVRALSLNAAMISVSYLRAVVIRRIFERLE